jgi:hypothetical protein
MFFENLTFIWLFLHLRIWPFLKLLLAKFGFLHFLAPGNPALFFWSKTKNGDSVLFLIRVRLLHRKPNFLLNIFFFIFFASPFNLEERQQQRQERERELQEAIPCDILLSSTTVLYCVYFNFYETSLLF